MLNYVIDHMDHDFNVLQSFKPESLHFTLNDEAESTIEYQITASSVDLDGDPVITGNDFISPHNTHWRLRYGASINIMAGIHTGVEMEYGANYMSVTGSDWLWYFNQRSQPFDGRINHAYDNVIGTPPQGLYYESSGADASDILTAILDSILGRPNSMPFTYSLGSSGLTLDHYRVSLGDATTLMSMVKEILGYSPGKAFEVTPARVFEISTASRWYGEPEDVVADGSTGAHLIWIVDSDHPPVALKFGNTGPAETHLQAEGSGTTTKTVVSLGNLDNQEVYWRTDRDVQLPNAITRTAVEDRAHEQLEFDLNPVHEIPLSLDPDIVDKQRAADLSEDPGDEDGFFWTNFKPGRALWIDLQLIAHHIDSPQHIVSIDATVGSNGVTTCDIGLNQIYDTTGQAHVDEG